ncbi:MAG: hypothetical protein ACLVJ6_00935 [Merdibacter sp.]
MRRYVSLLEGAILPSLEVRSPLRSTTSLIQMAYNLVDMIWIGRIVPMRWRGRCCRHVHVVFQRSGHAFQDGRAIKVGQSLGHDDRPGAASYAHGAIVSGIVLALVFSLVCVLFAIR